MLGSGTGVSVGSTLRILLKKHAVLPDDAEDDITLDVSVAEISEVLHRVAWSVAVPAGKVGSLGGVTWRRDSLQVVRLSADAKCQVVWLCEYKYKRSSGDVDRSRLDLGMKTALSTGLSTALSEATPISAVPPAQVRSSSSSSEGMVKVLDVGDNKFVSVATDKLVVGDICSFQSGDVFPADVMLLTSSAPQETAVTYAAIDGCDTLRLRKVCQQLTNTLSGVFASSSEAVATDSSSATGFSSGLCPACTYQNDPLAESCDVCGTVLLPSSTPGSSGSGDVLSSIGKGSDSQARVASLIRMLSLLTTPARLDGRSQVLLRIDGQTDPIKLGTKQYLPGVL
jgi:hypothetical protein